MAKRSDYDLGKAQLRLVHAQMALAFALRVRDELTAGKVEGPALDKTRALIKSLDGAVRHARGVRDYAQSLALNTYFEKE